MKPSRLGMKPDFGGRKLAASYACTPVICIEIAAWREAALAAENRATAHFMWARCRSLSCRLIFLFEQSFGD
jgi:hypothetical protein